MPVATSKDLVAAAEQSGLFSPEQVAVLTRAELDPTRTAEALADQLVEEQKLTSFQAEQLLAGKGETCVLTGRYHLLERLGAGGMGEVFKARDTKLDRLVAIKVMAPHLVSQKEALVRFQREAKALAKVSHPGIVQAHDTDEDRGRHFLVMEFVEGVSLMQVLRQQERLAPTLAADYARQTAAALQHAHDRGLIHRDVKPHNLLLTPQRHVKLLDLGLAHFAQDHLTDAGLTREGAGLGTPDYMAPEQFLNARHVDSRADIYALGCTLYHLVSGRVPFPGTSLAEKARAHEQQDPPPLEELCAEAPAGLTLAVNRMMAKRPVDRFQSMQEVVEALAPFVANSSYSLPQIKATTSWQGSKLSFTLAKKPPRKRIVTAIVGAGIVLTGVAILSLFVHGWLQSYGNRLQGLLDDYDSKQEQPAGDAVLPDSSVLTVSKDAKDGGQFRTIQEALSAVQPGQTIRVLDAGVYNAMIRLAQASRYAHITIEAPRAATLSITDDNNIVVVIDVPGVTIRGFKLRGQGPNASVAIAGRSPGTTLEDLDIESNFGMVLWGVSGSDDDPPVLIHNCTLRIRGEQGIRISGIQNDYKSPRLCRRLLVRNNHIQGARYGLLIHGLAQQVQLVGNRVSGSEISGIALANLLPGTQDLLIANNTFFENHRALTLFDDVAKELPRQDIHVRNNLIVESKGLDFVFMDGTDPDTLKGEGDGTALGRSWQFTHNWREVREPGLGSELLKAWVPIGPSEVRQDRVELLSREQKHPNFLRPAKDSPLATGGAGKTDPRLPSYVGAVPPEGVSSWDWDRTWRMPKDAQLLTVSKEEKDGGQYRSIGDALSEARPWAIIRVLDDGVYTEQLSIGSRSRQTDVTLEAPKQATIEAVTERGIAISIVNVPGVTIRGFRLRASASKVALIQARGACSGLTLDHLELDGYAGRDTDGIQLVGLEASAGDLPAAVRNCVLRQPQIGIGIIGVALDFAAPLPCARIMVRDNLVIDPRGYGIMVRGLTRDVQVVGNRVRGATTTSALQVDVVLEGSVRLLIANNTVFESTPAFQIWDDAVRGRNMEFCNNLFLGVADTDMLLTERRGGDLNYLAPGDSRFVQKVWRFHHNWREISKPTGNTMATKAWIPPGASDILRKPIAVLSRDLTHADFLRPAADSPLATGGAGKDDPSLPLYAGAVPPKGTPAWDWDKTWRWRMKKIHRGDAESAEKKP